VEETWKPATAGTLNIISGCFGIVGGVYIANIGGLEWDLPALVVAIVGVVGISRIALGVIALIGGIFARGNIRQEEKALGTSTGRLYYGYTLRTLVRDTVHGICLNGQEGI